MHTRALGRFSAPPLWAHRPFSHAPPLFVSSQTATLDIGKQMVSASVGGMGGQRMVEGNACGFGVFLWWLLSVWAAACGARHAVVWLLLLATMIATRWRTCGPEGKRFHNRPICA